MLDKELPNYTRDEILERELKKNVERKTMLQLQIALQKKLEPSEKSAKKPRSIDSQGRPISWETITRAEHIQILENELQDVELIIKTIIEI